MLHLENKRSSLLIKYLEQKAAEGSFLQSGLSFAFGFAGHLPPGHTRSRINHQSGRHVIHTAHRLPTVTPGSVGPGRARPSGGTGSSRTTDRAAGSVFRHAPR